MTQTTTCNPPDQQCVSEAIAQFEMDVAGSNFLAIVKGLRRSFKKLECQFECIPSFDITCLEELALETVAGLVERLIISNLIVLLVIGIIVILLLYLAKAISGITVIFGILGLLILLIIMAAIIFLIIISYAEFQRVRIIACFQTEVIDYLNSIECVLQATACAYVEANADRCCCETGNNCENDSLEEENGENILDEFYQTEIDQEMSYKNIPEKANVSLL